MILSVRFSSLFQIGFLSFLQEGIIGVLKKNVKMSLCLNLSNNSLLYNVGSLSCVFSFLCCILCLWAQLTGSRSDQGWSGDGVGTAQPWVAEGCAPC